jgi:hypothetical protein
MTIGERAAQAIHERSADTGVSPAKIMESMGGNRKTLGDWEKRNRNPQAYWLQQMALAGYDTYWILTGQRQYQHVAVDFDIVDYEEEL